MEVRNNAWKWVPSLYFIEGTMFVVVMSISAMLLKRLDVNYSNITLFTGWLYLPWVLLPFWKPITKKISTYKWWICIAQLFIAMALGGIALFVKSPTPVFGIISCFAVVALCGAFLEVVSEGYYTKVLNEDEQRRFISPRSKIYHAATIVGLGLTLMIAGGTEVYFRQVPKAWHVIFIVISSVIFLATIYHVVALPRDKASLPTPRQHLTTHIKTLLQKRDATFAIIFILLFNLPKALLAKINLLYLIDPISKGGLALSLTQIGFAQGTIGIIGLSIGGFIGNNLVARDGARKWLWLMALSATLPNFLYVYLSTMHIANFGIICSCIFIEQFGYGFGLTIFLYFIMHFTHGEHESEHYSLCSALMALGLMLPGILSGEMLSHMGYANFFWLTAALGTVSIILTYLLRNKID